MTDGVSNVNEFQVDEVAEAARNSDITIFVIGVGEQISMQELEDIASPPSEDYIHLIDTFFSLESVLAPIMNAACIAQTSESSRPRAV